MQSPPRPVPLLIARNLTARADRVILGNPANSRPESGVDNCYPGLEFDKRTLDQCFFPGLRFEFHAGDGAILVEASERLSSVRQFLERANEEDLCVYLWALRSDAGVTSLTHDFASMSGIDVWREVNALDPGRLTIVLGKGAPTQMGRVPISEREKRSDMSQSDASDEEYIITKAERSAYLDRDGVIDPAAHPPGDLTKTMCAPWMYDFRDCFCYYWAASKPDLVNDVSAPGKQVSFIRNDRSDAASTADQAFWEGRVEKELTDRDFVNGAWQKLPIVIGNRETFASPQLDVERSAPPRLTIRSLAFALRHLATIEHALMAEYLYARYSLRAGPGVGEAALDADTRALIDEAAAILLGIAIDEMRHLKWVNAILRDLGQPISLGRAKIIPEAPKSEGNPDPAVRRRVTMRPLTPAAVQDFVDAERHSDQIGTGLDGLYVALLASVLAHPADFTDSPDLAATLKLIIDEGADHFRQFERLQTIVSHLEGTDYLHVSIAHAPTTAFPIKIADFAYCAIIDAIAADAVASTFMAGSLSATATRAMRALDRLAFHIACVGGTFRFRLPRRIGGIDDHPRLEIAEAQLSAFRRLKQAMPVDVDQTVVDAIGTIDELLLATRRAIASLELRA